MRRILFIFLLLVAFQAGAQEISVRHCCFTSYTTREDSLLIENRVAMLREQGGTTQDLVFKAAKSMYGTPYVANLLGLADQPERFRITLAKTDCILFVEAMLCLARTAQSTKEGPAYDAFAKEMAHCRYRRPHRIEHFSDRIHYTTEWIRNLEKRGVVKDITLELGGEVYNHPIGYMSAHPSAYKMGVDDIDRIKAVEAGLNREPMTLIPPEKIPGLEKKVRSGDIICYVTGIEGLDISHVVIACVQSGELRFIHASSADLKVELDKKTVAQFVAGRRNCVGIKVVRPL